VNFTDAIVGVTYVFKCVFCKIVGFKVGIVAGIG